MSTCDQKIDCCPPTPFDYLIPTTTFLNVETCAVAYCPDSTHPTTYCVPAGTVASSDSIADANNKAYQIAIAQAQSILDTSGVCVPPIPNVYWCCVAWCNLDGTKNFAFSNVSPCLAAAGQVAFSVPARRYFADTQDAANQMARDAIQAQCEAALNCSIGCQERWWAMTCPNGGDGSCLTSAPTPSDNLSIGHVAAGDPDCFADTLEHANEKACLKAKSLAQAGLSRCSLPAKLSGLQWLMPCIEDQGGGVFCSCTDPVAPSVIVPGDAGRIYTVVLRIRGSVELNKYINGSTVPGITGNYVVLGGNPTCGYPTGGPNCGNGTFFGANVYELDIYDHDPNLHLPIPNPITTYFLNNNDNQNQQRTYCVDYQLTVTLKAGNYLLLVASGINGTENNSLWTPNALACDLSQDPPLIGITIPYHGQFMQMDVVSVT